MVFCSGERPYYSPAGKSPLKATMTAYSLTACRVAKIHQKAVSTHIGKDNRKVLPSSNVPFVDIALFPSCNNWIVEHFRFPGEHSAVNSSGSPGLDLRSIGLQFHNISNTLLCSPHAGAVPFPGGRDGNYADGGMVAQIQ